MCTVTFIPSGDSIFITSNRDESPGRNAKGLFSFHPPDKDVVHYPLDKESGGSWIALSDSGRAVCLLNGAFTPFVPESTYRMSRGLVVVDAISEPDLNSFLHDYDLAGIAPFTLLVFDDQKLIQLIWDGKEKQITPLNVAQPSIWSSVTLYPKHIREWRKSIFEKWLTETETFDRESIIAFHQIDKGDDQNDFVMNRNEIVKTLSVTSIVLTENSSSILHLGLNDHVREEILVKHGE